jgi:hypothetical protein
MSDTKNGTADPPLSSLAWKYILWAAMLGFYFGVLFELVIGHHQ